ncbi:MAG: nuclear transport factor 2 family protein [Candidatus Binataceae bacterium]
MSQDQMNEAHAAVERIFEAWDRALGAKDLEAALALYAPDATIESPLIPHLLGLERGICRGREEMRRFVELVFQTQPAARKRFRTGYFSDGAKLMWEYPRATPDGEQMDFVEVMELKDGLIQHHRVYWGWFGLEILKKGHQRRS